MVEYLQDFAKVQEEAGHIAYGTSVNRISRDTDSGRFWLDLLPSALDGVVSALIPTAATYYSSSMYTLGQRANVYTAVLSKCTHILAIMD